MLLRGTNSDICPVLAHANPRCGCWMSNVHLDDRHFVPAVKRWFSEPLVLTEGKGAVVRDSEGKEYLDLFAGHAALSLGYCHPKVVSAIKEQAEKLIFSPYDFHTIPSVELADRLVTIAPKTLKRCYFASAGAEAVECALYMARKFTKKFEIIALYGAFHGRTYGARSAVGWYYYKRGMGPYLPGVTHIPSYYCYRCVLGLEHPSCDLRCAKMLEDAIKYQCAGDVAAFIAEPLQGTAGNVPAPDGYFAAVEKILGSNGILFIDDEVITGFGRTGKLFAIEHYGVTPDLMTVAKALGGGVPISGVVSREDVAQAFAPMDYFTTYGGNPLSCAAANAAVQAILDEKLSEKAARLGDHFLKRLGELTNRHKIIGDVRGKGLLIGMELVLDRRTKEPARRESLKLREEARKRGLLLPAGFGWLGNVVRINPPLVITEEQVDEAVEKVDECLKVIS